jgi:hypothetical protein
VQELDERVTEAAGILATRPGAYRPGTLSRLADAYAEAGDPDKAAVVRKMAAQDAFVLPFAQASADRQQRMIDELPEGELRDSAIAIQGHQTQAFTRDPFAAGTALYKEVGAPVPIDDVAGRVQQARMIAQRRGTAVAPFTADEIDDMHARSPPDRKWTGRLFARASPRYRPKCGLRSSRPTEPGQPNPQMQLRGIRRCTPTASSRGQGADRHLARPTAKAMAAHQQGRAVRPDRHPSSPLRRRRHLTREESHRPVMRVHRYRFRSPARSARISARRS